jgi:riboflavin kinase
MQATQLRASASRISSSSSTLSQRWWRHRRAPPRRRAIAAAAAAAASATPPQKFTPSPAGADPDPEGRRAHNARQAEVFSGTSILDTFTAPQPPEIEERLARIARAATRGLDGASPSPPRVVDVGAGTGCLVPHLRSCGVEDILAVDVSEAMLAELRRAHNGDGGDDGPPSSSPLVLGNTPGARTWCGDFVDLPAYMGPVDAVIFNACYGNMHDPRRALLRASLLLRPGGRVVVSHPLGRAWHAGLRAREPGIVPHALPANPAALAEAVRGLPLVVEEDEFVDEGGKSEDEEGLYCAVLSVPRGYALDARAVPAVKSQGGGASAAAATATAAALRLEAPIVRGFGRGSRQLGVPTANLDPQALAQGGLSLDPGALPRGVYFGWARVMMSGGGGDDFDHAVHPMVMNVGLRPTVNVTGEEDASVEVHVMHRFSAAGAEQQQGASFAEFYGARMRVVVTGFLRPEMRFDGLPALLSRIKADIGLSKAQLLDEVGPHAAMRRDAFFFSSASSS